jgi:hypothetical protein
LSIREDFKVAPDPQGTSASVQAMPMQPLTTAAWKATHWRAALGRRTPHRGDDHE